MAAPGYLLGELRLDAAAAQLLSGEMPLDLRKKAIEVLSALAQAQGEVVSKDELMQRVWPGLVVEENNIQVHISAIRKLLERHASGQVHLVTVPGRGYRLLGARQLRGDAPPGEATRRVGGPSVAVMRFACLGGQGDQQYFADGLSDDIATGLSRVRWLSVVGGHSSFAAQQPATDIGAHARTVGADYVLHGSVRRSDDKLRVSAHLLETAGLADIWSARYDRQLGEVFALQDEIAASVVGAIEPGLRQVEVERLRRKRPEDLGAYELVLRAFPFVYKLMPSACAPAIPLLEAALAIEPGYAMAHAMLAWCHHVIFSRGGLDPAHKAQSLRYARAAVALGADDALSLAIGGFVLWFDAQDSHAAFDLFNRALAISPSNVLALATSSVALAWSGEPALAQSRATRALELNPFDALRYVAYQGLSGAKFQLGEYEAARDAALRAVEANPGFTVPYAYLCAALARLGRLEPARECVRELLALDPGFSIHRFRVTVGINSRVFDDFASAWRQAGLPD